MLGQGWYTFAYPLQVELAAHVLQLPNLTGTSRLREQVLNFYGPQDGWQ